MRHRASPGFWERYGELPADVQRLANRQFALLKRDPSHPSLQLKRIGRFWSVRVGLGFRALAVDSSEGPVWFWIVPHHEYDKLLRTG